MAGSGELAKTLQAAVPDPKAALHERLAGLIASHPVMLFMKGSPAEPRCVPGGGAGGGAGAGGAGTTARKT